MFTFKRYFVYNLGVSGDDTFDVLRRFEPECQARQPNIIVLALSGNDSQFLLSEEKFRVELKTFTTNVKELIAQAKKYTPQIIMVGITKVDEAKINKIYKNETIKKYDDVLRQAAQKKNLHFIPVFNEITVADLDDGLHPSSQGHQKMFLKIKGYIDELV